MPSEGRGILSPLKPVTPGCLESQVVDFNGPAPRRVTPSRLSLGILLGILPEHKHPKCARNMLGPRVAGKIIPAFPAPSGGISKNNFRRHPQSRYLSRNFLLISPSSDPEQTIFSIACFCCVLRS